MKPAVAFLATPVQPHNDNHERLPQLFKQSGWHVDCVPHDALGWQPSGLRIADQPAARYDLVWPVGLGPRSTFLDRQELLSRLDPAQCINAPASYIAQHGKSAWLRFAPPTHVASDADTLMSAFQDQPGVRVMKPLAGSFGRNVFKITDAAEIRDIIERHERQYWMLQPFIEAIAHGETRTLVCAGEILGSYLRVPTQGWLANLSNGGVARTTTLDAATATLVTEVCQMLRSAGIRFAAIDTVGGYVMEVNIANPGGLGTLSALYGEHVVASRMANAIAQLRRK